MLSIVLRINHHQHVCVSLVDLNVILISVIIASRDELLHHLNDGSASRLLKSTAATTTTTKVIARSTAISWTWWQLEMV